jgi:hypothetical protein
MASFEQEGVYARVDELNRYQFTEWYPLVTNALKCRVIELPMSFKDYLEEEGILLPKSTPFSIPESQMSDDDDVKETDPQEEDACSAIDLSVLDVQIHEAIQALGGKVFVKLNWSAPTDASWINCGLMCTNVGQIYQLLKASDRIQQDLDILWGSIEQEQEQEQEQKEKGEIYRLGRVTLVLKKWANFHPAMEFRVFIFNSFVVGVCQRECSAYYDFLTRESDTLCDPIVNFYLEKVKGVGPQFDACVLDVYVDKQKRVWLIDVNPFGVPTNPLLFEWVELQEASAEESACDLCCEFRVVESESLVMPNQHSAAAGPVDAVSIAQGGVLPRGFEYSKDAFKRDQAAAAAGTADSDSD